MSTHAAHHEHHDHDHHGGGLTPMAISATLHCLTGCAIGEVLGMVIGTAAGFSNAQTVVLAVALAFLFGYGLTSLPLLRGGLALSAVIPIALASDTFSIATMEIVDNALMLAIPGAMEAGVHSLLFWGSLSVALVIAGVFAVPVNRYLIARGKGHAVVHETGIHGGPSPRSVAIVAAVAAVFGTVVLVNEAINGDGAGHGGGHGGGAETASHGGSSSGGSGGSGGSGHGGGAETASHGGSGSGGSGGSGHGGGHEEAEPVRGLAVEEGGMKLVLGETDFQRGRSATLRFTIDDEDGEPVRDFDVVHERRMHLIVVRRDLTGFQHLHPKMAADGTWSIPLRLPEPGSYRVFADFETEGESHTLASDLFVDGAVDWKELPAASDTATTPSGYEVELSGESELRPTVTRGGKPVKVEPYLGANGHLVALREGDLAFLHVHPEDGAFVTEFPSAGRYRLFLQFKHEGRVHTAAFTRLADPADG